MRPVRAVRLLLVLALGFGVTAAVLPGTAAAATFQTITVDLNGDGIPDHVALGQVGTSTTCSVTVEHGKADGTFGAPREYDYTSAETFAPFCPNIGAAVKLGNHKKYDLVTAFSFGFQDIVVLHNFQPAGVFAGIIQPDFIRASGDFDGDGRPDIVEGSDQESEIQEIRNMPDATLARGAVGDCTVFNNGGGQYVLADFNGDGGQDMLLSSICPPLMVSVKAEVLFGNGQAPVVLASTSNFNAHYVVFSIDLNYDGIPDAGVIEIAGSTTTEQYFLNDGHGHFTSVAAP
ncbi:MAG TPA: VCBS repeat-containing protein [Pseudonocardiaceae bacterium]